LIPIAAVLVMLPLVVLVSAISIIRHHTHPWIWVAIVSGLIPLGTPCVCFNVVFAFWLLHLALQRPIRDALPSKPELA
jgi:hypothetical protein